MSCASSAAKKRTDFFLSAKKNTMCAKRTYFLVPRIIRQTSKRLFNNTRMWCDEMRWNLPLWRTTHKKGFSHFEKPDRSLSRVLNKDDSINKQLESTAYKWKKGLLGWPGLKYRHDDELRKTSFFISRGMCTYLYRHGTTGSWGWRVALLGLEHKKVNFWQGSAAHLSLSPPT